MKFSVIIVSYNAPNYLRLCLQSVQKALENTEGEIIVFDNNSPDRSIEQIQKEFPAIQFILSEFNLGFGKANNKAVKVAKGEVLLILNPDTFIPEDTFSLLEKCLAENENIGAIGPKMIDAKGKFHPESKRNIPTIKATFSKMFGNLLRMDSINSSYYVQDVSSDQNGIVPILTGAFLCIKKSLYSEIGGFDERYFMYGEDIDFCYSLNLKGYKNYYLGELCIIHYKGESTRKDERYLKNFYGAMKLFMDKYYSDKKITKVLIGLGIQFKYNLSKFTLSTETQEKIEIEKPTILQLSKFSNKKIIQKIEGQKEIENYFIQPEDHNFLIGETIIELP